MPNLDFVEFLRSMAEAANGFYTLGVLREIEALVGRPLHQRFELVFGTSTGAVIAALIALGKKIDDAILASMLLQMTHDTHPKVNSIHLKRAAYLYIRQSTLRQVFENTESTKRQYGLRQRLSHSDGPQTAS